MPFPECVPLQSGQVGAVLRGEGSFSGRSIWRCRTSTPASPSRLARSITVSTVTGSPKMPVGVGGHRELDAGTACGSCGFGGACGPPGCLCRSGGQCGGGLRNWRRVVFMGETGTDFQLGKSLCFFAGGGLTPMPRWAANYARAPRPCPAPSVSDARAGWQRRRGSHFARLHAACVARTFPEDGAHERQATPRPPPLPDFVQLDPRHGGRCPDGRPVLDDLIQSGKRLADEHLDPRGEGAGAGWIPAQPTAH